MALGIFSLGALAGALIVLAVDAVETWRLRKSRIDVIQWIPCEKKTPEEDVQALTTIEVDGELNVTMNAFSGGMWDSDWGLEQDSKVIAWVELPGPYREEQARSEEHTSEL